VADGGLENIHNNNESFIGEGCFHLALSVVVEPFKLPVAVLDSVELLVGVDTLFHRLGDHTSRRVFSGPRAVSQDLS